MKDGNLIRIYGIGYWIMKNIGDVATVLKSNGLHSKRYVGMTGVAVMSLSAGRRISWVLRFASYVTGNDEGLYDENELCWK